MSVVITTKPSITTKPVIATTRRRPVLSVPSIKPLSSTSGILGTNYYTKVLAYSIYYDEPLSFREMILIALYSASASTYTSSLMCVSDH